MSGKENRSSLRSTEEVFVARYKRFGKENPEEFELLKDKLRKWGLQSVASGLYRDEPLSEIIALHIDYTLDKRREQGVYSSVEQYVDNLFSEGADVAVSADLIMSKILEI